MFTATETPKLNCLPNLIILLLILVSKLNERIHCSHRHCLHTQLWDGGWRRLHPVTSRNGRQRCGGCQGISQYQQLQWNVTAYRTCVFTYNCRQTEQQGCGLTVCITLSLLNIMAYALSWRTHFADDFRSNG